MGEFAASGEAVPTLHTAAASKLDHVFGLWQQPCPGTAPCPHRVERQRLAIHGDAIHLDVVVMQVQVGQQRRVNGVGALGQGHIAWAGGRDSINAVQRQTS